MFQAYSWRNDDGELAGTPSIRTLGCGIPT